uniref:Protein phosphatase n=1 Tax=Emiliania huxleyi TaxID=2903 RepID=A0A6U8SVG2_EMIHU|mmetsp:Transcript_33746/g.107700  ORF Transcript_33746/g.107700 Transcript_33746/m.107700 type:complete len:175 (-) Transcript_33746:224-748(-)
MTASQDASLVRVPVRPGDILVLATDGLFDNVDEEALLDTIEDLIEGSGTGASPQQLADAIAARAKELSLDKSVDSPFAILAKDNDILWGGGRPDDITVLVSHILDRADARAPPTDWAAVSGPGEPPPELLEAEALLAAERLAAEARTASGLGAERGEEEEVERLEEEARVGASR